MTMTTDLPLSDEYLAYDDNISETQYSRAGLIEVYYSPRRFATETVFALVAAGANLSVLVAMRRAYDIMAVGQNRTSSAYSLLFVNLSIANSLSCILSWLSNNSLFMFDRQLIDVLNTEPCLFFGLCSRICRVTSVVVVVVHKTSKRGAKKCTNGKRNRQFVESFRFL